MDYPEICKAIDTLTPKQREMLDRINVGMDERLHPRVVEALMKKGLIEQREETLGGRFPVRIKRYSTNAQVSLAWCEWCAAHDKQNGPA